MTKQQQKQRDQLVQELHAAEEQMVVLKREQARAVQRGQEPAPGYKANEQPASRVQVRVVSEAARLESEIRTLHRGISDKRAALADLDRAICFAVEVEQAGASHQAAVVAVTRAQETLSALRSSRSELVTRLEQLQVDAKQRLSQAIQYENERADEYTAALKIGAVEVDQAGESMRQASVATALVKQEHAGKQKVFEALGREIASFDEQIDAAVVVAEEAANNVRRAVALKLGIAWDEQVGKIVSLGVELLAARKAAGMPVNSLSDINIPCFSTYKAKAVSVRELEGGVTRTA